MLITTSIYESIKEKSISGRYLPPETLLPVLKKFRQKFSMEVAGRSEQDQPIYQLTLGKGPKRILMWSQMHGNETTTTKAVCDLLNFLDQGPGYGTGILEECTIRVIPMLNPDGARAYTRVNANEIDLNRDAQELSQSESRVLRNAYEEFLPGYCFNLHDQRTIFSVGNSPKPATVSFLAPAHDEERSVSESRAESMRLISAINHRLQALIPGQVGRYDDAFNLNCVGDTFQSLNTPTLLFEAGHYPGDYEREKTRELLFQALIGALEAISSGRIKQFDLAGYLAIPENDKRFLDVIIKNPNAFDPQWETGVHLGIQFREVLDGGHIHFRPQLSEVGQLDGKYGHRIFDCKQEGDRHELQGQNELLDLINGSST